ncbi:MAG: cytidine deaminase [Schleiferiaceae bacterium]|jgi:cytidine deaminase
MKIDITVQVSARTSLSSEHQQLLNEAFDALDRAYAPYSNFRVAAAVRLTSGEILTGTNQENASYPVGICAERVALSTANSVVAGAKIHTMAVVYRPASGPGNVPLAPCGMCRQALVEQHARQGQPFELFMAAEQGDVWHVSDASSLLPLAFTPSDLG